MSIVDQTAFFGGAPGGQEILIILFAILLLFGSKKLPHIARSLGRSIEEFRRAARDVTDEIMHAADEPDSQKEPPQLPALEEEEPPQPTAPEEEAESEESEDATPGQG